MTSSLLLILYKEDLSGFLVERLAHLRVAQGPRAVLRGGWRRDAPSVPNYAACERAFDRELEGVPVVDDDALIPASATLDRPLLFVRPRARHRSGLPTAAVTRSAARRSGTSCTARRRPSGSGRSSA